ncbi:MAG: hydroxymethylbilane synthase [Candidatus Omnitrophica bacterium]|nr:hydroxymethylbilane synthase [Candidatus Omnitrophota bacterium]
MPVKKIIIGTRGSPLAMAQSKIMIGALKKKFPHIKLSLKKIVTKGDGLKNWPPALEDKGFFVKDIEEALASGKCDIAVHSIKDMPVDLHPGLEITAIPKRENAQDVLLSKDNTMLEGLKEGAVIGTSSIRRRAQLLHWKKSLVTRELRGNVDTRIKKLRAGEYDAIVLAAAGVVRIGLGHLITQFIPFEILLPAPGQGAIALETRSNDSEVKAIVKTLDDYDARACVTAERAVLKSLGGGCQVPISAYCCIKEKKLLLKASITSVDGEKMVFLEKSGEISDPVLLGERIARDLTDGEN